MISLIGIFITGILFRIILYYRSNRKRYDGDKSLKQFMELNKIAYKKMNREEAMNYINKKFKEIESLS